MSDRKVAFARADWIDEAKSVLEDLVAKHGEAGKRFSVCEVFSGAPQDIAPSGTAAWHFYIDGKSVTAGAELNSVATVVQACLAMEKMDLREDCKKIKNPTLVITAAKDMLTPMHTGPDGAAATPTLTGCHRNCS